MDLDTKARIIASAWHGGQRSPLYALSSSGAIIAGVLDEIDGNMAGDPQNSQLAWLYGYVQHCGFREPVDGWSELHWTSADERKVWGDD